MVNHNQKMIDTKIKARKYNFISIKIFKLKKERGRLTTIKYLVN